MARPSKPLTERIANNTTIDGEHHFWQGEMRNHRPHLRGVGNPVRVLLDLPGPNDFQKRHGLKGSYRVQPNCPHIRCINPLHWLVSVDKSEIHLDYSIPKWTDPRPPTSGLTRTEEEDLTSNLKLIKAGEQSLEDTVEFYLSMGKTTYVAELRKRASDDT